MLLDHYLGLAQVPYWLRMYGQIAIETPYTFSREILLSKCGPIDLRNILTDLFHPTPRQYYWRCITGLTTIKTNKLVMVDAIKVQIRVVGNERHDFFCEPFKRH